MIISRTGVAFSCRFPGPSQTVQRAEFWGASGALRAFWPGLWEIDRSTISMLLGLLVVIQNREREAGFNPLPLVKDGDLISLVHHMIRDREPCTVGITKVKSHATDDEGSRGQARVQEHSGHDQAASA